MNIMTLIKMEEEMISKSKLTKCVLVACSFCAMEAGAAGSLFESLINVRTEYNDNITYTSNPESASYLQIQPKVNYTYKENNWDTTINGSLTSTTYSSEIKDTVDSYLDLGTAYKNNRNTYSIVASHKNYSNRASEENEDIIGLSSEQIDFTVLKYAPKYTRDLSERLSLSIAYSYSDTSVSPETSTVFLPYETNSLTGTLTYLLSQKSVMSLTVDAMDYTSADNISEYELLASRIGLLHNFSEMVTAKDLTLAISPPEVRKTLSLQAQL